MKHQLTIALSILALSLNVFAADAKGKKIEKKAAAAAAAETYKVDTEASTIEWKGSKKVGSAHTGQVKIQSGEFTVENNAIKSGQVVADMKTITNTDLTDADSNKKLVGHLSNADFFDSAKHPTSTFKLTSVSPAKAKDVVNVKGELTMLGKTNPIEFPATVKWENGTAMGTGTLKIDRTKWGLQYRSGNFFKDLAGDKIINDEFELNVKIVAKK
jgi:polyisoprenoid-binding protein YceI